MKARTALLALLFPFAAHALPASVDLTWTNPTASVDGVPATGANALTGISAFCRTTPFADIAVNAPDPIAPSATFGPVTAGTVSGLNVNNGDTLYCRIRAINASGKSAFSAQGSKVITLSTIPNPPGAPVFIKIDITIDGATKTITFP